MGCCGSTANNQKPTQSIGDSFSSPAKTQAYSTRTESPDRTPKYRGSIRTIYEIKSVLGEGALGPVYYVRDKVTRALSAMKEFPKSRLTQQQIDQLILEVPLLTQLVIHI